MYLLFLTVTQGWGKLARLGYLWLEIRFAWGVKMLKVFWCFEMFWKLIFSSWVRVKLSFLAKSLRFLFKSEVVSSTVDKNLSATTKNAIHRDNSRTHQLWPNYTKTLSSWIIMIAHFSTFHVEGQSCGTRIKKEAQGQSCGTRNRRLIVSNGNQ